MPDVAASFVIIARLVVPAIVDGDETRADLLALLAFMFAHPGADVDALARAVRAECYVGVRADPHQQARRSREALDALAALRGRSGEADSQSG